MFPALGYTFHFYFSIPYNHLKRLGLLDSFYRKRNSSSGRCSNLFRVTEFSFELRSVCSMPLSTCPSSYSALFLIMCGRKQPFPFWGGCPGLSARPWYSLSEYNTFNFTEYQHQSRPLCTFDRSRQKKRSLCHYMWEEAKIWTLFKPQKRPNIPHPIYCMQLVFFF